MAITINLPDLSMRWKHIFIALIIATVIVLSIVTKFRITTLIIILIFTFMIFILINTETGINYEDSLPSTTYPVPPHLGLDGVDLENRASF